MVKKRLRRPSARLLIVVTLALGLIAPSGLFFGGHTAEALQIPAALCDSPSSTATVTPILGEVLVRRNGTENWLPVAEGEFVSPGDTVRTGQDGRAYITFFEGSESLLDVNTEMTIQRLSVAPDESFDIKLHVWLGNTWHNVQKFYGSESRYEVETPSATLVARGTLWWVRVDEQQKTTAAVIEGKVDMTGEFIAVDPKDVPAEDPVKPLIDKLALQITDPAFMELVARVRDEGIPVIRAGDKEKLQNIGLGVVAQAYYLAQHIGTLPGEQAADIGRQLGCDGTCTAEDLLEAKVQKLASWGEIKQIIGGTTGGAGETNGGQSEDDGKKDKENKDNNGQPSKDADKGADKGSSGKKSGGKQK